MLDVTPDAYLYRVSSIRQHFRILTYLLGILPFLAGPYSFCDGQYLVEGKIKHPDPGLTAYLDVLNEWDDYERIAEGQILKKIDIDSSGYFSFSGAELSNQLGLYKVHFSVDSYTPYYMSWTPDSKNFLIFCLSNTDTLFLAMKTPQFVPGTYSLTSSLPANQRLLDACLKADQFYQELEEAQTPTQSELIESKQRDFFASLIEEEEDGLVQVVALTLGNFDPHAYQDLFMLVADRLQGTEYRDTYTHSLDRFLGAAFYRDLQKENTWYRWALLLAGAIILLLIILLFREKARGSVAVAESVPNLIDELTPREKQIFQLMAEGKTNKEISNSQSISESTVKSHINNIYRKTGIKSRKELQNYAARIAP